VLAMIALGTLADVLVAVKNVHSRFDIFRIPTFEIWAEAMSQLR
jgi:hypothetical protein